MLLILTYFLAAVAASPLPITSTYDQRQDGDLNVRADVQNVMLLFMIPPNTRIPPSLLDLLQRKAKPETDLQDRSDSNVLEAFAEPAKPYQVEIAGGEGRHVEVVIAGRRRLEGEPQPQDEYKLIGAMEQCGPEGERDPVTLTCRLRAQPEPALENSFDVTSAPEVIQISS